MPDMLLGCSLICSADSMARTIAGQVQSGWRWNFVVDNREGAAFNDPAGTRLEHVAYGGGPPYTTPRSAA